jgi:hypothetical protein
MRPLKNSQLFIKFPFIRCNNLKTVERKKYFFSFQIFMLPSTLPPFALAARGGRTTCPLRPPPPPTSHQDMPLSNLTFESLSEDLGSYSEGHGSNVDTETGISRMAFLQQFSSVHPQNLWTVSIYATSASLHILSIQLTSYPIKRRNIT